MIDLRVLQFWNVFFAILVKLAGSLIFSAPTPENAPAPSEVMPLGSCMSLSPSHPAKVIKELDGDKLEGRK